MDGIHRVAESEEAFKQVQASAQQPAPEPEKQDVYNHRSFGRRVQGTNNLV